MSFNRERPADGLAAAKGEPNKRMHTTADTRALRQKRKAKHHRLVGVR